MLLYLFLAEMHLTSFQMMLRMHLYQEEGLVLKLIKLDYGGDIQINIQIQILKQILNETLNQIAI